MISEEKIIKILHNKSEDRILELRKNCKEYSQINDFLYKSTEKTTTAHSAAATAAAAIFATPLTA